MTIYIKLSTGEYPRHEGDIRLEHPEILESQTGETFPCPETYAKVQWVDFPEINANEQLFYELPPIQVNSVWTMVWGVRDLTDAEKEERQVKPVGFDIPVERI
jgi:hypothetical protein